MNFLYMIELIVDTTPSATRKSSLLEKLESLKTNIAEYAWLKEKINELKNRKSFTKYYLTFYFSGIKFQ